MYTLELHPSTYNPLDPGYPHPKFENISNKGVIRVEICRISGTPIYALGLAPIDYPDHIMEQMKIGDAKSMADLSYNNVIIVKKNGVIMTAVDIEKLSFTYTKPA